MVATLMGDPCSFTLPHVNPTLSRWEKRQLGQARLRVGWCVAIGFWLLTTLASAQPSVKPGLAALSPSLQQEAFGREILHQLLRGHYNPISLDDQVSSGIFDSYIKAMDPSRSYFRSEDIAEFDVYRSRFDDLLKVGDLSLPFRMFNRYRGRVTERLRFILGVVERGFDDLDFDKDEVLARKNVSWGASEAELRARWRRQVKNEVLGYLLSGTERGEIRELLRRRYSNQLVRLRQLNGTDAFRVYINSFLRAVDPHSLYFPPHQSENFNIHLSLSLEGIGAVLQADGEDIKVVRLVAGGPADKAGDLKPGDRIVSVGQGVQGEFVHVVGMRLRDVVTLIRGPKGTTVRLAVIPQYNRTEQRKVVRIVRNKVELEDQQVSRSIRKVQSRSRTEKIGIVHIPTFYLDFAALRAGDSNFKSTASDVKRLIDEFREADVDGLVIDLRGNGGGALREAIALAGLFIKKGPVVQVRDGRGVIRVHSDTDRGIAYNGPLAVLVNRLSASASEIFAAAIQDYGRGLVIGGQTFGKGTVQTLIPIRKGHLKLTQAKFYRISGEGIQNRGVIPDIKLPSAIDKSEVGESSLGHALAWDVIDEVRYSTAGDIAPYLESLTQKHSARAEADPDFVHLVAKIRRIEQEREKANISLRMQTRRDRKRSGELQELKNENRRRAAKGEKPLVSYSELVAHNEKNAGSRSSQEEDTILGEAVHILADLIGATRNAAGSRSTALITRGTQAR